MNIKGGMTGKEKERGHNQLLRRNCYNALIFDHSCMVGTNVDTATNISKRKHLALQLQLDIDETFKASNGWIANVLRIGNKKSVALHGEGTRRPAKYH